MSLIHHTATEPELLPTVLTLCTQPKVRHLLDLQDTRLVGEKAGLDVLQ